MNHQDESAMKALKASRVLLALAALCCAAAFGMGFAALSGRFTSNSGAAAALLATLIMLALLFGALGASRRSAARQKGWVPASELSTEAIQAKTRALEAALAEELASQARTHDVVAPNAAGEEPVSSAAAEAPACSEAAPASEEDADPHGQNSAPEKEGASGEERSVPEDKEHEAEPDDSETANGEEEPGEKGKPVAYKAANAAEEGMSEEEMVIAAAEALLAEAAHAAPEEKESDQDGEHLLTEEDFLELAGMSPFMRNENSDEEASNQSTIRTRRIAKERISTVDKMLSRAEDVIAVSRDLARSNTQDPAFATLSSMLRGCIALDAEDMPQVKPIKLTRNDRYWMGSTTASVSQEIFDALLSLEAVYNINQDVQTMLGKKPEMERQTDIRRRVIAVLSETSKQKPNYQTKIDYLHCAYGNTASEDICSDWALRAGIATAAENAALPFRLTFDMMTNAAEGIALLLIEIPRPRCFGFLTENEEEQAEFARDYAIRSAIFMARAAFGVSFGGSLKQVVVCCHPRGDSRTLLSVEATPESLPKLKSIAGCLAPIPHSATCCDAIRISCEESWLDPVEPHLLPGNDALDPLRYIQLAESSTKECSPLLSQATGAARECDLGIRAEAPMEQAWIGIGDLGDTVESAVAAIRIVSDEAETQDVRDGCDRAMRALVEGEVEPDRIDLITKIYRGDAELADTLAFGLHAYTSQSAPDMERAISRLSEQLDTQTRISLMDDTETAFRYFHSITDRIHYNLTCEDARKVELVPHNYYAANEMAAYLLCQVGRPKEAEPFAYEIKRIAPYAPASATILARVLERQERIMEAIEVVNEAIFHATTVHDAALCYYRMAYLQWRCGHEELANASYRLTVALHTEISKQARQELDELLASNPNLSELSPTSACKKLAEAGVHIWDLEGWRDRMAQAAILCADQQLFTAASQLTLALLEFQKDDAITDVYRSFSV